MKQRWPSWRRRKLRDSFVNTLYSLAQEDPKVMLLVGDLGFGIFNDFRRDLPDQFLNVGVAEQNLMGVSTGLALEGRKVFAYSIANFPTLRALEQIRNDICYHKASVCVVAAGVGLCYGALGASHHATEDMACLRGLPNLTLLSPGDPQEADWATRAAHALGGPCYLRIGRAGEPRVHPDGASFTLGKIATLSQEGEVALLATGGVLQEASWAAEMLAERGIKAGVHSVHTIKPLDGEKLRELASSCRLLVSVEEHTITGGLGTAIAEVMAEMPTPRARLLRLGIDGCFVCNVGNQEHLRRDHRLSAADVAQSVEQCLAS